MRRGSPSHDPALHRLWPADVYVGQLKVVLARCAPGIPVNFGAGDLGEIVYLDHFGNAMTGLRACNLPQSARLTVAGRRIPYARVFAAVPSGEPFWYENSIGLAEIAANMESAARRLGLTAGQPVTVGA